MNADSAMISVKEIRAIIDRRCIDYLTRDVRQRISATEVLNMLKDILFECEKASASITELDEKESLYEIKYQSKNERTVANAIKQLGYTPYHNVIKKDCVGSLRPLPFDFGILVNGQELLIEFDGEQHEMPVKYFGGAEKAAKIALHDAIKTEYCKRKGIPLLRLNKRSNISKEVKMFVEAHELH